MDAILGNSFPQQAITPQQGYTPTEGFDITATEEYTPPEGFELSAQEPTYTPPEGFELSAQEPTYTPPEGFEVTPEDSTSLKVTEFLDVPRQAKRLAAVTLEAAGDVVTGTAQLGAKLADIGLGAARNLVVPKEEEKPLIGEGSISPVEGIVPNIFSGENIRKYTTEPAFGKETLRPRSDLESSIDEVARTLTALAIPLPGGKRMALTKAAKIALGAEGAKELTKFAAKSLGLNESLGDVVKVGTLLGATFGMGKPSGSYDKLYKASEKALETGKNVLPRKSADIIVNSYDKLKDAGVPQEYLDQLSKLIDRIKPSINPFVKVSQAKVADALDLKRSLNSIRPKLVTGLAKNAVTSFSKTTKAVLGQWSSKNNLAFYNSFLPAEELYIAEQLFHNNKGMVAKNLKDVKDLNPFLALMFKGPAAFFGKIATSQAIDFGNKLTHSPIYRNAYEALAKEMVQGTLKEATVYKMNNALNKMDESRRNAQSKADAAATEENAKEED